MEDNSIKMIQNKINTKIKEKSGFEGIVNPLTPKPLDNYKYKGYINFSIREAGLEELADSPVSKTGGSQALWVRNSSEFPHPARKYNSNNNFGCNSNNNHINFWYKALMAAPEPEAK